jgi:F-type H+-transporting ATPase subunit b
MESLGKFGIEPIMLAAQVVNFLIIAFVLQRFLIRPILTGLKKRREAIQTGLENARKAREALANAESERERLLADARTEAAEVLDRARVEAERILKRAAQAARVEADRLLAESRATLEAEREQTERELRGLSLDLSGKILELVVRDLFTEDEKSRVVARGLQRIAEVGAS